MIDVSTLERFVQLAEAPLHIVVLGPPDVRWQAQSLTLPRRQARALLYRMAASSVPVPRDHLCFLLWPDIAESTARRNLTVLLNLVRRALPQPDMLITSDDAIMLDRAAVWSDAPAFADMQAGALRDRRLDLLANAVAMYRGPFLHGFSLPSSPDFAEWIDHERHSWERRYLEALGTLVDGYTALHDFGAAITTAQRYVATDELAEEMHARLIALYAAVGDRAAALRQYERCVVALERELGIDPLPETRAVYQAVRDGEQPPLHVANSGNGAVWRNDTSKAAFQHSAQPDYVAGVMPSSLPMPTSPLIGRADDLDAATALLQHPDVRLVTLCGSGGSGKTRLAVQLAWNVHDTFTHGVAFVPLAPLRDPALVLQAIAQACGIPAQGPCGLSDARAYFRAKHALLVLDNFEHVAAAAPIVTDLLAHAPKLRVLVTSRSLLNLSGEHPFFVQPLALPDLAQHPPLNVLAATPAVALLVARARALNPDFELTHDNAADVAAICTKLDGLPLAIELAAARLKLLPPRILRDRLDSRLALLTDGPRDLPDRQRTLRTTIEWSYRLLGTYEQLLFERLAVFAGGWTLDAAEHICQFADGIKLNVLDGLQTLLDNHLVTQVRGADDEPRFGMLETIREYAQERLRARGGNDEIAHAHASYFAAFAEAQALRTASAALGTAADALDRDSNNLRAALRWALHMDQPVIAARIFGALLDYWDIRGLLREAGFWWEQVRPVVGALPQPVRAHVRSQASFLAFRQGDREQAAKLAATVLRDARVDPVDWARALGVAGLAALEANDVATAMRYFEQNIVFARTHALLVPLAGAEGNLGLCLLIQGEVEAAEAYLQESLTHWGKVGHSRGIGLTQAALGFIAVLRGQVELATSLMRDALDHLVALRETTYLLYALLACCGVATIQRKPLHAAALFQAATRHADERGMTFSTGLFGLAQAQVQLARRASEAEAFERASKQGETLSIGEAVALARSMM